MSDLIAVAYPDRDRAEAVRRTLGQLSVERVIELEDVVVVTRDERAKSSCTKPSVPAPPAPPRAPCGAA